MPVNPGIPHSVPGSTASPVFSSPRTSTIWMASVGCHGLLGWMSAEQARSAATTRQLSGATEGSGYTEEGYEVMKCITLVLNSSLFLDLESRFHTTVGSVQVLSCLTRLIRNPMSFIKKKSQKNPAPTVAQWIMSGYPPEQYMIGHGLLQWLLFPHHWFCRPCETTTSCENSRSHNP